MNFLKFFKKKLPLKRDARIARLVEAMGGTPYKTSENLIRYDVMWGWVYTYEGKGQHGRGHLTDCIRKTKSLVIAEIKKRSKESAPQFTPMEKQGYPVKLYISWEQKEK